MKGLDFLNNYVYNTLRKAPKNFEAGIKMYAGQKSEDQKEQEGFAKMKKVSGAGAGLLKYVYAIVGYNKVFVTVKPKRDKVR